MSAIKQGHLELSNRFQVLEKEHETMDILENNQKTNESSTKRQPPIIITQKIYKVSEFMTEINETSKEPVTIKINKDHYILHAKNSEDRDYIISLLNKAKTAYHTFASKEEKVISLVIKGLPKLNDSEVLTDLQNQGLQATTCTTMRTTGNSEQINPFYKITLQKGEQINKAFMIKQVMYVRVKWERYKNPRKATQCHRCQRFGHGSNNCKNPPRCVKCTKGHITKDCVKTKEENPQCVNCNGEHPANYTKCPAYLQHIEKMEKKKEPHHAVKATTVPVPEMNSTNFPQLKPKNTPTKQQSVSYGDQTRNIWKQTAETDPVQQIQEIYKVFSDINNICDLSKLVKLAYKIRDRLMKCENEIDRVMALAQIVQEING